VSTPLRSPTLEEAVAGLGGSLADLSLLAGDGSDRQFFRLSGDPSLILLYHPTPPGGRVTENDSYFLLGGHLSRRGLPVPEIFTYCREEGWMLLEDLGDLSLEGAVKEAPGEEARRGWYHQALKVLVDMQLKGREGFDPAWCFDTPEVDRPFLRERECGYFVWAFLKGCLGLDADAAALEPDFQHLLARALPGGPHFFLHRDFQSRNLFIKEGRVRVIDFQGGRLGPLGYDLAALLIDPYVALAPAFQEDLLEHYLDLLTARLPLDRPRFREQYRYLALCRNLQALGAYGFLSRVKGKTYFEAYIPQALSSLRRRLGERPGEFPRLEEVLAGIPGG